MRKLPWVALTAVGLISIVAVLAPYLGLADPTHMSIVDRFKPPSTRHWLGTDSYGRDELSRVIWGARVSLQIAFFATLAACVLGVLFGTVGGYLGGVVEILAIRSMDVILCFPPLLLALLIVALLGPSLETLIPVLTIVFVPGFARVAYAGVLSVRSQDYVVAMHLLGAGQMRIILRTILPNISGPLLVQFSLTMAAAIILESGLSFLGLGVVPPTPSWGLMIGDARATMTQAPMLLLWPCLALALTILAMNALCDGLRDAIDPRPTYRPAMRALVKTDAPDILLSPSPTLALDHLSIEIEGSGAKPVRDVHLSIAPGETLALVGESGSGKSVTSLAVMGLLPWPLRIVEGTARLAGDDLLRLEEKQLRRVRGADIGMIFQDPTASLNPTRRVGAQIAEAIAVHRDLPRPELKARVLGLLREVGIADPEQGYRSFPHQMSGGMRQRVMIAMAVANDPRLLIADEPTTALDVTIQAQILELLAKLKKRHGSALLFVTHNLPVVNAYADHVAVMYAGEIVEDGPTERVFASARHPYTKGLLASVPNEQGTAPVGIPGVVPQADALPPGCLFAPRCPHRQAKCEVARPRLMEVSARHRSSCVRWAEL